MNPEAHEPAPVARDNVREGIFPRLANVHREKAVDG
jgi:hypothetical protein